MKIKIDRNGRDLGRIIAVYTFNKYYGKNLRSSAQVHHIDGNETNNNNTNLVICQSKEYHNLLHVRTMALRETGDVHKRKCWVCKNYDDIVNLKYDKGEIYHHTNCFKTYMHTYNKNRKNKGAKHE